ncbi:hypothetical protein ACQ4PT_006333 [Festuca glaucescens]
MGCGGGRLHQVAAPAGEGRAPRAGRGRDLLRDPAFTNLAMEPPPWRWAVSYSSMIRCSPSVQFGVMVLRLVAQRLVLFDDDDEVVDARCLRENEVVQMGNDIDFVCHVVRVGERLDQVDAMASMPCSERLMSRLTASAMDSGGGCSGNWWLYRSPGEIDGGSRVKSSWASLDSDRGTCGPKLAHGPFGRAKAQVNSVIDEVGSRMPPVPQSPVLPSGVPREGSRIRDSRSYEEVLLTKVRVQEVAVVKRKRKTRHKMVGRSTERWSDDRRRREDERERDSRRFSGGGGGQREDPVRVPQAGTSQWQKKAQLPPKVTDQRAPSSNRVSASVPSTPSAVIPDKHVVCYKCDVEGHNSKECSIKVQCLICEKESHVTRRCVWPNQPKPIMPAVGLADPGMWFFVAQQVKTEKKIGLIQVVIGSLTVQQLSEGLGRQFQCQWAGNIVEKGQDFMVQFPSVEKLKFLMGFDEFRLKGTNAYIKVTSATKKVEPSGRLFTVWARAEGVPDESKHYKGICEVGSLIGAVEDVDMQILADLDIVRFQVDMRSVRDFPMVKQYAVKSWMYNITFSIEKIVESGTLDGDRKQGINEVESGKEYDTAQRNKDEDENARVAKKLKAVDKSADINTASGPSTQNRMMLPLSNQLSQMEKDKLLAHRMQHVENKNLLEWVAEKEKEKEESFATKVGKAGGWMEESQKIKSGVTVKSKVNAVDKNEEPRRCERLKNQEDADRTELAMKRAAMKNEIPGVTSGNGNGILNMVTVVKALDSARVNLFEEAKKDKNMIQHVVPERFAQDTEETDADGSDNDNDMVVYTSPGRTQLNKPVNNKIVKLCSPVFRVELAKIRGRTPKKSLLK